MIELTCDNHQPLLISHIENEADRILPFDPIVDVDSTASDQIAQFEFHCPVAETAGNWAVHHVPVWRYAYPGTFKELQPYPWMRPYIPLTRLYYLLMKEKRLHIRNLERL